MDKETPRCLQCEAREALEAESEEMSFAVLVALVPVLTITLFNVIGLL